MGQARYEDDTDVHSKGDSRLNDRRLPWRRLPRRCNSTTVAVLLEEDMVRL